MFSYRCPILQNHLLPVGASHNICFILIFGSTSKLEASISKFDFNWYVAKTLMTE
jgi:hypothetical protein